MPTEHIRVSTSSPPGIPSSLLYVVVIPNKWSQLQTLRVCFRQGNKELRQKIIDVATTWFHLINLKLDSGPPEGRDCADKDPSEIRVGFKEPGYWSYIGTDSIDKRLINSNLSSMNFEGFDKNPPSDPEFTSIVLHEWGHALGLHHEHQSPASGCDNEYNWKKLYKYYSSAYGWDKKTVDENVKQLMADRSAFDWSKEDSKSIMIYASDPQFLYKGKKSKCYFKENIALSNLDKEGISKTYPVEASKLALKVQATTLPLVIDQKLDASLLRVLKTQNELSQVVLKRASSK